MDGLADEIVGARLERGGLLSWILRGDDDHRQEARRPDPAQAAAHLVAVDPGHHHVQEHEIGMAVGHALPASSPEVAAITS